MAYIDCCLKSWLEAKDYESPIAHKLKKYIKKKEINKSKMSWNLPKFISFKNT